jgi:hypothetical protein
MRRYAFLPSVLRPVQTENRAGFRSTGVQFRTGARGARFLRSRLGSVIYGTKRSFNVESAQRPTRDTVFVAGGQPSITYVDRAHLRIEENLRRALKAPNQIVSLAGPSKSGKTVLCREVLSKDAYIWIEGGQIEASSQIWEKACYVLNYPIEIAKSTKDEGKAGMKIGLADWLSFDGSVLKGAEASRTYKIDTMTSAIRHLKENNVILVIDDFHYLPIEARTKFLRSIKGPVFDGLKLVLISVTHRGLDAVKAESELQGRVSSVVMPEWGNEDLTPIAEKGFVALTITCASSIINRLTQEAQNNPFLMQKLCWEVCAGIGVDERPAASVVVSSSYDFVPICQRLSKDFGHPIYQKLELGPQSRKSRQKRRLKSGGTADIYKSILMGIAATGPVASVPYDELRNKLNELLQDGAPQKHEITAALKHLSTISQKIGNDAGLDWDGDERKIDITDPYLRFYLRWQIRPLTAIKIPSLLDLLRAPHHGR